MADAQRVTAEARARAISILHRTNFFLYQSDQSIHEGRTIARTLAQAFGLKRLDSNLCAEDGLSEIAVRPEASIPAKA